MTVPVSLSTPLQKPTNANPVPFFYNVVPTVYKEKKDQIK